MRRSSAISLKSEPECTAQWRSGEVQLASMGQHIAIRIEQSRASKREASAQVWEFLYAFIAPSAVGNSGSC
ncbi:hypothetical protein CV023_12455 [Brevibacterium sp. CCUG 69071]|nr:hypothetical protein [Brevibacterium sp. CCUG 69071]